MALYDDNEFSEGIDSSVDDTRERLHNVLERYRELTDDESLSAHRRLRRFVQEQRELA